MSRSFRVGSTVVGGWIRGLRALSATLVAGGFVSVALVGCPAGGVGDPCTPEDEYRENFSGFALEEENIESRSFQCDTRVCLVNHFQGRASCKHGQPEPKVCSGGESACDGTEQCLDAGVLFNDCDPTPCGSGANPANCNDEMGRNPACKNEVCDKDGRFCRCNPSNPQCPDRYTCDSDAGLCKIKVCSLPLSDAESDRRCYVPGTGIPIAVEVCGQCDQNSGRDAEDAVYCSCRCGPPSDGASEADANFNFCTCDEGYECVEIRPNVGLGDAVVAGKYCVKQGTTFEKETVNCGTVDGHVGESCQGTPK